MFQEWPVVEYRQGGVSQGPLEEWDDTWRRGSGMMGVGGERDGAWCRGAG